MVIKWKFAVVCATEIRFPSCYCFCSMSMRMGSRLNMSAETQIAEFLISWRNPPACQVLEQGSRKFQG